MGNRKVIQFSFKNNLLNPNILLLRILMFVMNNNLILNMRNPFIKVKKNSTRIGAIAVNYLFIKNYFVANVFI